MATHLVVRKIALNILLSIVSIVIVLILGEFMIRFIEGRCIVDRKDDNIGSVSSRSVKSPDADINEYRIVGIGDSFTYGSGVTMEETYLNQLKDILKAKYRNTSFQVLNLGHPGYNTVQEYKVLLNRGLAYKPHLIVVGFVLNDAEMFTDYKFRTRGTNVDPSHTRPITPSKMIRDFMAKSYLYRFIKLHIIGLMLQLDISSADHQSSYIKGQYSESYRGWAEARESLKKMKLVAVRQKAELLVVVFPLFSRFDQYYPFPDIHKKISEFCQSNQIE
ncbi:MAG: SGNH/GDSL hydrolase family protein, partial [Candidatus Scalindua sp.]|nr:SGNH/GDSL hydrolase family protein [Candidatus Scalindua sp.]